MAWLRIFVARTTKLFHVKQSKMELRDEFSAHLEMAEEEHLRRGMTKEEARYAARRAIRTDPVIALQYE